MNGLACASATTAAASSFSVNKFLLFPSASPSRAGPKRGAKRVSFRIFAAKEEPKFDKWDQMELKFGRLLGEDPKLTLAKIMGRKANPEASYIEIEKAFHKNKGKIVEVEEVPFDVEKKSPTSSSDSLNLVRPVPKKGIKFKADGNPAVSEIKRPTLSDGKTVDSAKKGRVPNVILRKPTLINEDDVENLPRFRIKPNLSLKMRNEKAKDHFSEMTLLRKPEPMSVDTSLDKKQDSEGSVGLEKEKEVEDRIGDFTILEKSEQSIHANIREMQELFEDLEIEGQRLEAEIEANMLANATENTSQESLEAGHSSIPKKPERKDDSISGMQPVELSNRVSTEESSTGPSIEAALQGKPKRLDQSVKETSNSSRAQTVPINPEDYGDLPSVSPQEDSDWTRVEHLLKTGERAEVELISSSTRGFVVSFGSLIGFLPYRNLAAKWKFLAFESWLRQKGLDLAAYKQNLGVIGSSDIMSKNSSLVSNSDMENNQQFEGKLSPDMNLEDLLKIYDQEKLKFLSSFVGQRVKVNVLMADRKFRKLIVSLRPKAKEELVEKKRNVMAKLRVGDVVKCCIKKITYFGIFVEVEGVPALIHQTEVSWDATLDPASYFKIGQIVEAKVHQLDFTLERVFLSLKEITPDPLIEALDSVVGDRDNLDGRLQAAEADSEWPDVESLIKELQQIEGVQSVSKGRFFLSPGLAPTFQVYMASMFENQYKLLARSGNKVQEIIVLASLDKEEMKSTILSCTNRVI
ncbi:Nucleic acid-binding, OB-fold-like protein, putative isoform 1 [Theobroma cacao]|uniref:Nucleic acid-binding, OB-fold-like protein, putative isoform 1 n=1 Tax=Theobroma cacao TaxID=3641 RepID=A0A061G557_THECC|nr:Nucleic acid-binding, OB-fold-like protein, putative isoform 1 [Theobroma cacao]